MRRLVGHAAVGGLAFGAGWCVPWIFAGLFVADGTVPVWSMMRVAFAFGGAATVLFGLITTARWGLQR